MSAALDDIRASVGAGNCSESCSRDGCVVDLTNVPPDRLIVDVDKAFPAQGREGRRCDFILFVDRDAGSVLVAPVELKSGWPEVLKAIEQLRGGADLAADLAPSNAVCLPILFHGKGLHNKGRRVLNRTKIKFRGLDLTVMAVRCNRAGNLAKVLPA